MGGLLVLGLSLGVPCQASVALAQAGSPPQANAEAASDQEEPAAVPTSSAGDAMPSPVAASGRALSVAELSSGVDEALARATAIGERIKSQLRDARDAGDVVRALCLDDKRSEVEAAQSSIAERRDRVLEANAAGAVQAARHHYSLVMVLSDRVAALGDEAGQCLGEETSLTSDGEDGELAVSIDNILPDVQSDVVNLAPVVLVTPSVNSAVD